MTILNPEAALEHAALKLNASKLQAFELFVARSSSTKIESKDQKVESLTQASDLGLSVRVLDQARLGFSYTTSLEKASIDRAVDSALEIARLMPTDEFQALGHFDSHFSEIENRYDEAGLNVTTEVKIEAAKKIEALCKSLDPRIKTIRSAGISETLSEAFLQNHEGNRLTSRSTYFGASISCKAEENGEGQMGGDARFSNFFSTLEVDACAKEAAHTATRLLGAKPLRSGKLPAVIERGIVADLIDFLASSFLGDEMEKGRSMLQGKLGQKLFSEKVTLLDDGLLSKGYSTRRFDAEGSASQTTSLVDQGVFREILLDQTTARRMKMKSTGNSARSVKAPPSIATTNFYLRPGSSTFDELIESAHHGILITDLMGVHTANAITGDFSLGASGILIENGKLTRPVRGFAVAGNILQIFKTVATLGNDLRFYGGTGAPSILIPELAISGE